MYVKQPSQLFRKLLGLAGLNPFDGTDSASRKQMMSSSHLSQALCIIHGNERRCQTGLEKEVGKYTFSVKMPEDGTVVAMIDRYRETAGVNSFPINPQTIVLYESYSTGELDMIELTNHKCLHPYFGFKYKKTSKYSELRRGASFNKGTIFLDSPAINETGGYCFGRELKVALMSIPGIAEDGVVIARDVLPYFNYRTFKTITAECGSSHFPLFTYGPGKIFPDIGDYVRDDGVLMALRPYDPDLAVADMNIHAVQDIDFKHDKVYYAGDPGGRVVDIKIIYDPNNSTGLCPEEMEEQLRKYDTATKSFYKELLDEYNAAKRRRPDGKIQVSPQLHRMLVEALAIVNQSNQKIVKEFKRKPLDDWWVEITLEYINTPDIGNKITELHGGKFE